MWRFGADEELVPVEFRIEMTPVPDKAERDLETHGILDPASMVRQRKR